MGYQKPTTVSAAYLKNADLPQHGQTYTVVPHGDVIKFTRKALRENNFVVINEVYRANKAANVAQGVLYLKNENDFSDTGMMFGWTNSYDKSVRFQCAIGAYVMVCSNLMVAGDISYGRKHTGTAHTDIIQQIYNQIDQAGDIFTNINNDKSCIILMIVLDVFLENVKSVVSRGPMAGNGSGVGELGFGYKAGRSSGIVHRNGLDMVHMI